VCLSYEHKRIAYVLILPPPKSLHLLNKTKTAKDSLMDNNILRFTTHLASNTPALLYQNSKVRFKKLLLLPTLALMCISLSACLAETDETKSANAKQSPYASQIDQLFAEYDDLNAPGAAVAVVKDGQTIFSKGYGSANLEYDIPVSPSTVFHIASVSKQFTVFSILLLAEEGKLSFDDDIRKYIPEVPDFGKVITLRHLASHTSGLRDQWNLLVMAGWRFDDVITKEHVMKLVEKQKELNFKPGEEYLYSNTGFTLLAEVVARVSEQTFAEFTQDRIFAPLGMDSTLFYDDHQKIVKNRAYSYAPNEDGYQKIVLSYANVGATSLFTTVEDLSLWAMNFENVKVGSESLIEEMNTLAVLNNGETFGGAYGQFVSQHKGLEYIQHGGADAGYRTFFARFPEQGLAVSVFNNVATANPRNLALGVADIFLEDALTSSADMEQANAQSGKTKAVELIELDEATLATFEGHYWNEDGAYSRQMYIQDGVLMYSRGGENESPLGPISNDTFKMLEVDVDLYVQFDTQSTPNQMIVTEGDEAPTISIAYEPLMGTEENLAEYAGTYYSDELSTSYELIPGESEIVFRHSRHSDVSITPIKDNMFTSEQWVLNSVRFERDENNSVTGMRVTNGRVRNLYFERR
jgi:CubicO group peptidase (beta-lactamase class C family)